MASSVSVQLPPLRRAVFRLFAIALGFSVVLIVEGALRIANIGRIEDIGDPFMGFSETIPLFVPDETGQRFVIPESRRAFFQPDSFAARKGTDEFRIFCLGGSTVQGRPYSIETSFTTWLELSLKAASPSTDWQVVNCGGVSYASYRLVPIMREALRHKPDLFIIYTGHNEFLEERSYPRMKKRSTWLVALQEGLSDSRLYGVAWHWLRSSDKGNRRVNLPAEVDALLDYHGGLAKYHRDDELRDRVVSHYRHNLRRMSRFAKAANVPLVFVNPVCNVRDTPPFKVELASHLTDRQGKDLHRLWNLARASSWDDLSAKAKLVQEVLRIDQGHAEAHFLLAKVFEAMGKIEDARDEYLQAKDTDVCPLRMLEVMYLELDEVARLTNTPVVDARALFESVAEHGLPGDNELIDHVHPRIEGHQLIAKLLFDHMVSERWVTPTDGYLDRQQQLYAANYDTLPANYFPESVERLRGLQRWAEGRVTRLRLDDDH